MSTWIDERPRSAPRETNTSSQSAAHELAAVTHQLQEANALIAQLREQVSTLTTSNADIRRLLVKEQLKSKKF